MGTLILVIGVVLVWALMLAKWAAGAPVYPTSRAARAWVAPAWWLKQVACIKRFESPVKRPFGPAEILASWHIHKRDYKGDPSKYSGGLQFLDDTWERAGGTGSAGHWSRREQEFRAFVIWDKQNGRLGDLIGDWSEWGTAGKCGLR